MQAQGAAQRGGGVGTIPRRGVGWLGAVLAVAAVLVVVALMALMTREMVAPPADTGGVGAQDANKAGVVGSAVVHDDAGSMHSGLAPGYAPVHDDTGVMHASMVEDMGQMRGTDATGAGSAVVHDDAGNVR